MATFTYLSTTDWNYYNDFAGSSVLAHSATTYQYRSTAGLTVTLRGTGFSYDASGIPTAGSIARMDVVKSGTLVGQYSGLTTALTAFETLAFGHTSGPSATPYLHRLPASAIAAVNPRRLKVSLVCVPLAECADRLAAVPFCNAARILASSSALAAQAHSPSVISSNFDVSTSSVTVEAPANG